MVRASAKDDDFHSGLVFYRRHKVFLFKLSSVKTPKTYFQSVYYKFCLAVLHTVFFFFLFYSRLTEWRAPISLQSYLGGKVGKCFKC